MSIVSGASYTLKSIVERYLALVFIYISKQPDYLALSMEQLDEIRTVYGTHIEKSLAVILGCMRDRKCRIRYCKRKILHIYVTQFQVEHQRYYTLFQTDDMQWYKISFVESGVPWNQSYTYTRISHNSVVSLPRIPADKIFTHTIRIYWLLRDFSTKKLTATQFNIAMAKLYIQYGIEIDICVDQTTVDFARRGVASELDFMKDISDAFKAKD
jgi:hypothetical protein